MRGRLPDALPLGALERFRDLIVMPAASILRPKPNTYRLVAKSDGLHVIKWDGTDVGPLAGGGGVGVTLGYAEFAAGTVNLTATTEAAANVIVTAPAVAFDGTTTVWIEAFVPELDNTVASEIDILALFEDGTSIGFIDLFRTAITSGSDRRTQAFGRRKRTPSAGSHTYSLRGFGGGHGSATGGAGGTGNRMPAYISVVTA